MISISKEFTKSFVWNFIEKNALTVIGVFTSIIIARGLGPRNYGYYATILSVMSIIPFFISLGLGNVLNIYMPKFYIKGDISKVAFLIRSLLKIKLIVLTGFSIAFYYGAGYIADILGHSNLSFYFRLIIPLVALNQLIDIFSSMFSATLNNKPRVIINVAAAVITLIMSFIVLFYGFGIVGLLGTAVFVAFMSMLFYVVWSRNMVFVLPEKFTLTPLLKTGIVIWGASLLGFALGSQVDVVILNVFRVPIEQVGFYNLAFQLKTKMAFMTIGMGVLAQSVFSMTHSRDGNIQLAKAWELILKLGIILIIPVAVFFFIYAKPIINVLYSSAYEPVVGLFRIYLLLTFFTLYNGESINPPIMFVLGKEKINFYLQAFVGISNIILDIILIPIMGVYGAVLATVIAVSMFGFIGMGIVRSYIGVFPPLGYHLKILVICMIASFSFLFYMPTGFAGIILSGTIYLITCIFLLYKFKLFTKEEKAMVKRIDKRFSIIIDRF